MGNPIQSQNNQAYASSQWDEAMLAKYLSGEMDEGTKAGFEQMLISTGRMQEVERLRLHWSALSEIPAHPPQVDWAWAEMQSRIRLAGSPNQEVKRRVLFTHSRPIAAAAVVLVALAAWWLWPQNKPGFNGLTVVNNSGPGSRSTTLADGSVVFLASGTQVNYAASFQQNRSLSMKGHAYFDVKHNPSRPFVVSTQQAEVTVTGTSFDINAQSPGSFELKVIEGSVRVKPHGLFSRTYVVKAGQKLRIGQGRAQLDTLDGPVNWFLERVAFQDEALKNILQTINTRFGRHLVFDDPSIGDLRITLTFTGEDDETLAHLISMALHLNYKGKDGKIEFTRQADSSLRP